MKPLKRSTADMDGSEFLDYLIRNQRKMFLFSGGLAAMVAGIFGYAIGLSAPAFLVACSAGAVAVLVAGYMHLTEPEFVTTVPPPDPDYDYEADREEREYWTRIWEEEDRVKKMKSKKR